MIQWSVIIPTLWIPKSFPLLITELLNADNVLEIIIVSNATIPHKLKNTIKNSEKLTVLHQQRNIYVNPAWNIGVKQAQSRYIALCNDDILFRMRDLHHLNSHDLAHTIIGCSRKSFSKDTCFSEHLECGHYIGQGWGCLLLFEKTNYPPIPESLKIWCGDEWLALYFRSIKSINICIETAMSESTNIKQLHEIAQSDLLQWKRITSNFQRLQVSALHHWNGGSRTIVNVCLTALKTLTQNIINQKH